MEFKFRAVELDDADLFYEWENDMSVWSVGQTERPFSHFALEQYVLQAQNDTFYAAGQMRLMVDLIDQGETKTIGCVDLYDFSPKDFRAAMGILFSSEHRGRGYAKPVVEMLWEYVTKVYSLHCLYSFVPSDNLSSKKMLISSGFEPTGVLKDWLCENGKFKDVEVYQKINRTKDEK